MPRDAVSDTFLYASINVPDRVARGALRGRACIGRYSTVMGVATRISFATGV